ncbi:MAG: hypothetical protein AAFO91_03665, partial [Bacteroidota bacterium]
SFKFGGPIRILSPLAERGWQSRDSADVFVDGFIYSHDSEDSSGFVLFTPLEREFSCQNS